MKYPKLLQPNDTIGICAPSDGFKEKFSARFAKACKNVEALGYKTLATASASYSKNHVSGSAEVRAAEFMSLYENPSVAAIIPPWGGEFLMDMLPLLDFERICTLAPKWISGYSDITTLTFPLTLLCDFATIHGSNFMNFGYNSIHESDLNVFTAMSKTDFTQKSAPFWGGYNGWDIDKELYSLTKQSEWKSLDGKNHSFSGRMIGGCMDTLCKLIGTRFAPVEPFLEKYKQQGFVWTLESCEMAAADIYRTLWQMRDCGWFKYCEGIIIGRPDGYSDNRDFTLIDALSKALGSLNIPVIYDADICHIPPQMQIVNGAIGEVEYCDGSATVRQSFLK